MKVRELIEALKGVNGEMEVILQKDPEGNGYSPLADADSECIYVAREGSVYSTGWTSAEAGFRDEAEWQKFKYSHSKCVVLSPVD